MKSKFLLFAFLFLVTTTYSQVYVKQDATGNNNGSSWSDAYTNLQDAFEQASTGDEVWITSGTYLPTNHPNPDSNWFFIEKSIQVYGGFSGNESTLSERDWENNLTILSGDLNDDDVLNDFNNFRDDNAGHIVWLSENGITLDGVVISGGQARIDELPTDSSSIEQWSGAGVYADHNATIKNCRFLQCHGFLGSAVSASSEVDSFYVTHCNFENNRSSTGIFSVTDVNDLAVSECTFTNNYAEDFGGGLYFLNVKGIIEDCVFQNNSTSIDGIGGAAAIVQNDNNAIDSFSIQLINNSFENNVANGGGAIYFGNFTTNSNLVIDSCQFIQNEGVDGTNFEGLAGGLFVQNFQLADSLPAYISIELSNSIFENNTANLVGGAIFDSPSNDSLKVIITNSDFIENSSIQWGGGLALGNSFGQVMDCTFNANSTPENVGAGLFVYQNPLSNLEGRRVEIRRCKFENNIALAGAGIAHNNFYIDSELLIDSCIFLQNAFDPNFVGAGSGILIQNIDNTPNSPYASMLAIIENSKFEDNFNGEGGGAFIFSNHDTMEVVIRDNEFVNNNAQLSGGGIYLRNQDSYIKSDIKRNEFKENTAGFAGGALAIINLNDNSRLVYDVDDCIFTENTSEYGGAIWSAIFNNTLGNIGKITNSEFLDNEGTECCGAIYSLAENLTIDNTLFSGNTTAANDPDIAGGGGAFFRFPEEVIVRNSIFTNNFSDLQGAAFMIQEGERVQVENTLIYENIGGASTIYNEDSLWMTNVTMVDNASGIFQAGGGYIEMQNTILGNDDVNLINVMGAELISKGGNLSNDTSLEDYFVGAGGYADFNDVDPQLDMNFVPEATSPAIDLGNPNGILFTTDLAGNNRIQGNGIDIGALESPFTVSNDDLEVLGIDVYPNPFIDKIIISNTEGITSLRLLDILGKEVRQLAVQNELSIQRDLPHGMYLLELNINGKRYFKKLEKMN